MKPIFSHFSVLELAAETSARLVFPGHQVMPQNSLGYVRSEIRSREACARSGATPTSKLPWRDYPEAALTDAYKLARELETPGLVLGARNVMNEYGYAARINGTWWRRSGDMPPGVDWPCLSFQDGIAFCSVEVAQASEADLLIGVPLVRAGMPASREFLIAHCSDVAHSWEVHPKGIIGPSAEAWFALSNAWEQAKRAAPSDIELARELESIANKFGALPSRNLLHCVVGRRPDGSIVFCAMTGALCSIASFLAASLELSDALLLDNGGSVGWLYGRGSPTNHEVTLLAGPNYRPRGTVFLTLATGFPHPASHRVMNK